MLPQHLGWRPTLLTRHTAALSRPPLLRGIIGSPGCISHASYPFSRHTCHVEILSRVYAPWRSCISSELSIYHPAYPYNPLVFVVGLLAGQHSISLICKSMACSERLVIPPYRNADAAKVQSGTEEKYRKTLMRF